MDGPCALSLQPGGEMSGPPPGTRVYLACGVTDIAALCGAHNYAGSAAEICLASRISHLFHSA